MTHTSNRVTAFHRPAVSLILAGGLLSSLVLPGCTSVEGSAATTTLVERAVGESDLRKKRARQAAREKERVRLARKKARREANEKIGWLALSELEKYRSTHCYSSNTGSLERIFALGTSENTPPTPSFSRQLPATHGQYGSSGGGEGSGGDRGC